MYGDRLRSRHAILNRQHSEQDQVADEPDRGRLPSPSRGCGLRSLWKSFGAPRPRRRRGGGSRRWMFCLPVQRRLHTRCCHLLIPLVSLLKRPCRSAAARAIVPQQPGQRHLPLRGRTPLGAVTFWTFRVGGSMGVDATHAHPRHVGAQREYTGTVLASVMIELDCARSLVEVRSDAHQPPTVPRVGGAHKKEGDRLNSGSTNDPSVRNRGSNLVISTIKQPGRFPSRSGDPTTDEDPGRWWRSA